MLLIWSLGRTATLFVGTALGLGALAVGAVHANGFLLALGAALLALKLRFEAGVASRGTAEPLSRTGALLREALQASAFIAA